MKGLTKYSNLITECGFESQVADIRSRLLAAPQESRDTLESADPGALDRLESLLDRLIVLTSTAVPEVVPIDSPQEVKNALSGVGTAIALMDDPDTMSSSAGQITSATSVLAEKLWAWPGSASGDDWKDSVTGAAATYRRSLGQQLITFQSALDELRELRESEAAKLDQLTKAKDEFGEQIIDELAELKEKAATQLSALESQIQAVAAQATAAVGRQDTSIAQYQEQFSSAQEKRTAEFADFLQGARKASSEDHAALSAAGKEAIADLQTQIDRARDMVSVFAGAGTANAFGKEAQQQDRAANRWRIAAIVLGLIGAVAAVVLILTFSLDPWIDWFGDLGFE